MFGSMAHWTIAEMDSVLFIATHKKLNEHPYRHTKNKFEGVFNKMLRKDSP